MKNAPTMNAGMKLCEPVERLRVRIRGAVQGVGFRPFVFRLANELALSGWVSNSSQGVIIEVEGPGTDLREFLLRLQSEQPPRAFIQSLEPTYRDWVGYDSFQIKPSEERGETTALILPDIATCSDCLRELFDSTNRRYLYPFTNCTHCGPRFTIIESLPYDRARTTMKHFPLCGECETEYHDPANRRFHAQPNACPDCGPHLELWDREENILSSRARALAEAVNAVREGKIIAVKGLGGFHLMVDARHDAGIHRLRERKHREEKPFAILYPSLDAVARDCEVDELEARLLKSPESPIVLLRRRSVKTDLSPALAPGNPYLGVMLPYTPLHHILMSDLKFPVVATSGNLADETLCIEEGEAVERLGGIADLFLVHNRPIARHADDSIVRVVLGREQILRRARGYAPLPVGFQPSAKSVFAAGAHLKNTIAANVDGKIILSQHIGDLESHATAETFRKVVNDFSSLYNGRPGNWVCDAHPDYFSTRFAERFTVPAVKVQHHYAHVLSCMADNEIPAPLLGVAWDGSGYGTDGTLWGGEFLKITEHSFKRVGHFRRFRLPGASQAVREPARSALGLLYELFGDEVFTKNELAPLKLFSPAEREILRKGLKKNINSPLTSSVGRLFDAVASLIGVRHRNRFEGQAAMELEFLLDGTLIKESYPFHLTPGGCGSEVLYEVDWAPAVNMILQDVRVGTPAKVISARFHNMLADAVLEMAQKIEEEKVVLTGGCFQNKYLTEKVVERLSGNGFRPYWHQRIPPNDGGIAAGQIAAWGRLNREEK